MTIAWNWLSRCAHRATAAVIAGLPLAACIQVPGPPVPKTQPASSTADSPALAVRPPTAPSLTAAQPTGAGAKAAWDAAAPWTSTFENDAAEQLDAGELSSSHAAQAAESGHGALATTAPDAPRHPHTPGSVVITEFMADPRATSDDHGEWLELYNTGVDGAVDLHGCALDDGSAMRRNLGAAPRVPEGAYVTIGRSGAGALRHDIVLSFSLSNRSDRIALVCDDVEIDRVDYGPGFPLAAGASTSLDPLATDARNNDDPKNWCLSSTPLGSEFGTPGARNGACEGQAGEHDDEPDAG